MEIKRQIYYHVRYVYRQARRVKTWQLLLLLILVGFVAATFLRLNNIGMDQRRESVLAADKEARDGDVHDRLLDLQRYVSSHMNTSTGQFYLEGQYGRDWQREVESVADDTNPNGNINAMAEEVCAPRFAYYSQAYLQCFIDELNKYPSAPDLESDVELPHPALYLHSYAAPLWSPDFAGFSVLLFIAIALIIVARLAHLAFLYMLLKLRNKGFGS